MCVQATYMYIQHEHTAHRYPHHMNMFRHTQQGTTHVHLMISLTIKGMSSPFFTRAGDSRLATRMPRGFAGWTHGQRNLSAQLWPALISSPQGHLSGSSALAFAIELQVEVPSWPGWQRLPLKTHTWWPSCWPWLSGALGTTRQPVWPERR